MTYNQIKYKSNNYLMTSITIPSQNLSQKRQMAQFRQITIQKLLNVNLKCKCFKRITQFLALAIFDQFYHKLIASDQTLEFDQNPQLSNIHMVASALIAWKFMECYDIRLQHLQKKLGLSRLSKSGIIEAEQRILEAIEFIIPEETTFSSISRELDNLHSNKNDEIALKSIKFLKIAIEYSPEFNLNPQLGPSIVKTFLTMRPQHQSIKQVYLWLHKKQKRQKEAVEDEVVTSEE